eukprot:8674647-Pyramimonas_sp.AAC.2
MQQASEKSLDRARSRLPSSLKRGKLQTRQSRALRLYDTPFSPSRALAQWYNCASTKYGSQ